MSKYSKTPKLTNAEKLAFYKENGYFFGDKPKVNVTYVSDVADVNHASMSKAELEAEKEAEYQATKKEVEATIAANGGYTQSELSTMRQMKNLK